MKPTVSLRRKGTFSITTFLTVVSSVANNLFSANTSDLASRFMMVLLPTLVYPTSESLTIDPLLLLWVAIWRSTFFNCSFSSDMRLFTIRRSTSIWVSPIPPRVPIPPLWRSRWVHIPASRGSIQLYRANSTCIFAQEVFALWANISRIRLVRSMTELHLITFSIFLCCIPVSSSSKMTQEISFSSQ